jgi:hypothetical protein
VVALLLVGGSALSGAGPAQAAPARPTPGNVAVLVVDDFGLGADPQARPGTAADNCVVGTNEVGSTGAGDDLPPSGYSHGELVYSVLNDALTADLGAPPVSSTATTSEWKYPVAGGTYAVRLVAVHTDKYRVDDILNGIRDRIASLRKEKFERIVLNLSFAVIPCDVVAWLSDASLDELLKTYDEMIRNDSTSDLKAGLQAYFNAGGELDPGLVRGGDFAATVLQDRGLAPLRPYLADAFYRRINVDSFTTKERPLSTVYADPAWQSFSSQLIQPGVAGAPLKVVPVAASGNGVKYFDRKAEPPGLVRRGLPFPFAPALWDFVVSASADADPAVAARLNSGEIALDATGPALVPGSFGTSFAAPRLSALEAKYLAETGNVACGGTPTMGYVDLSATPVLNLSINSPWKNLAKADWPSICSRFPA